jgi:hypothetical protein
MEEQPYLIDAVGNIRFKKEYQSDLKEYFLMAGILIDDIKTIEHYKIARDNARPFFDSYLHKIAAGKPGEKASYERQALIAIAKGDYEESESLMQKAKIRRLLKVIS